MRKKGKLIATSKVAARSRAWSQKMKTLSRIWSDDSGQDLAEYGMLLVLVAVAIVVGITAFKDQISTVFSKATSVLAG
jgi:pilus assembly protein Flp/PilA